MLLRRILLGFAAGALAVLVFHQVTILILYHTGLATNFPWSMRPIPRWGTPALVNQMFWGGMWGVLYALIEPRLPPRSEPLRGMLFGVVGPWLIGVGLAVPYLRGGAYLFSANPGRIPIGLLIHAAFGLGLALFWRWLARWR